MHHRTPSDISRQDSLLSRLTAAAGALAALDDAFQKLLPPQIAGRCRAIRIRDGELVLFADNGMVAARLRMVASGLLPQLARQGHVAGRVHIRVQPAYRVPVKPKTIAISQNALDGMADAARSVAQPEVRAALERLIAHHRQR